MQVMDNASDIGTTIREQLRQLPEEQRIAYLLLARYCENYKHVFGNLYWPGWEALRGPLHHECFPSFVRLADYLRGRGLAIGDREMPWQGYIRFAFESFHAYGQIPCPAQLQNPILIRKYVEHQPVQPDDSPLVSVDYRKIVVPWLRSEDTLRMLGLL